MIERSEAPAMAALVAWPARKLCPAYWATSSKSRRNGLIPSLACTTADILFAEVHRHLIHSANTHMAGVLTGIRVLDPSTIVAGPAASMILADLGADAIKVERTGPGEDGRSMGPHRGSWGAYFTALNRGSARSPSISAVRMERKRCSESRRLATCFRRIFAVAKPRSRYPWPN